MNEEKKDVKKEEKESSGDSSDSKKTSDNVSEDVKNAQEEESSEKHEEEVSEDNDEKERIVEELLSDKTSPKKEVKIRYDKFTEINEKSKLYDSFSPLLAKMKDDPEAAKKLLGIEGEKETIEKRVARLEEEIRDGQRKELKSALMEAISLWPDIKEKWNELRPIVTALEKQGISSRNAIQRAYFAIHPDAAKKEERLVQEQIAREVLNRQGAFASPRSYSRVVQERDEEVTLSDADIEFARAMNIDLKLYKKHSEWVKKFENL